MGVLKYGIIAVVGRRRFGRIFHRRTACGFGLRQSIRGTISCTCDYTVTPPGKLAPLHLTPTRFIVVVFRLVCFFYIRIEIVLPEEQAPRRHISVPVVWSFLSVRFFFLLSLSRKCPWYFFLEWHHGPTASSYLHSCCADWVYWIWHDALKWWQRWRDNYRSCWTWRGNSTGSSSLSSSATHVRPELDECPAEGKYGIERSSISGRRSGVF